MTMTSATGWPQRLDGAGAGVAPAGDDGRRQPAKQQRFVADIGGGMAAGVDGNGPASRPP